MFSARVLAIAGVILVGAAVGLLLQRTVPSIESGGAGTLEESAPAWEVLRNPAVVPLFQVRDLDGNLISSANFRGKITLLNFWATWCPPCLAEIPALVALQETYRDHLQIVGISEDEESVDVVRRFVARIRVNYPVAMTTPDIERAFPGVEALPTSFLIDRESRVVRTHVGMLSPEMMEREVRSLAGLPVVAPAAPSRSLSAEQSGANF